MSELPLKEAIKILTQEKKKVELKLAKAYDSFCLYPNERDQNDWDHFSALDSAFEMGISALVELNNKKSSDTINRQDAIDAVHKNYDTILDFKSDGRTVADSFEDIINALPSAQPEPSEIARDIATIIENEKDMRVILKNSKSYEVAKRLNDLIFDINPTEIYAQIEVDNLKQWCEIIQTQMKMAMVQLPCYAEKESR